MVNEDSLENVISTMSNVDDSGHVSEIPTISADDVSSGPRQRDRYKAESNIFSQLVSDLTLTLHSLHERVSYDDINQTLITLTKDIGTRRVGTEGNARATQFLMTSLKAFGFDEASGALVKQGFYSYGLYTENVIATIPSDKPDAPIVVLSAHYDSVRGTEGAVDNASGVAALLETARVIKQSDLKLDFELRICFFSAEEDGYIGAYHYIEKCPDETLRKHACILNTDMAGHNNSERTTALVVSTRADPGNYGWGPAPANCVSDAVTKAYRELNEINAANFHSPANTGRHDIIPFMNAGIDCATLSWREIDANRAYDNDLGIITPLLIHTPDDTLENLNIESVYMTTRLFVKSIAMLDEKI
ncbi:MAG: M20/M25/M40 family metallo-hydrolase [Oscillospiraceae bacterium]